VKSDDDHLTAVIRDRTRELLMAAIPLCRKYRTRLPEPDIRFDLRGLAAGQVRWLDGKRVEIRYNLAIAHKHRSEFLARTVPHEVAHVVTVACHGRTAPHGTEWQAIMRYLGIAHPERCHAYDVDEQSVRRQRRWTYRCDCRVHSLSTTRHRRVEKGTGSYHCRRCGARLYREEETDGGTPQ
jgi:SprT protein